MNVFAHIAMIGWAPFVLFLFSRLSPRRAVIAAFVIAWLFLPVAHYSLPALPDYTKMFATCVGVLLGAALFDSRRFSTLRPTAADLPVVFWCMSPFISSLSNDLGLYDAFAAMLFQTIGWGLPYYIGRLYLTDRQAMTEFGVGIFLGGLAYVLPCLYEIRMSPQLHRMIYGFFAHSDFSQTMRMGGYRPMVFMEHGLMLGMFMCSASLLGIWMYGNGSLQKFFGARTGILVAILLVTTVLVKALTAMILLLAGLATLYGCKKTKTAVFAIPLLIIPLLYQGTRATNTWDGMNLVDAAATIQQDRSESLRFRIDNENILVEKALQRPVFGWGGWGRARVYNDLGEDISVTDGLWIISLGNYGLFGLFSFSATLLLPTVLFLRRHPPAGWGPDIAATAGVAVLSLLYMIDTLLNAMVNPMFLLSAGGLVATLQAPPELQPETRASAIPQEYVTRIL